MCIICLSGCVMKWVKNLLIVLIIGTVTACSTLKDWRYATHDETDLHSIYVVSHGWHTGMVIPQRAVRKALPFLNNTFSRSSDSLQNSSFFEIGWGDKGFYQSEEITSSLTLQAIFWPTDSVMHVVAFNSPPDEYFIGSEVVEVPLSSQALQALLMGISSSFYYDKRGEPVATKKGLYGDSYFYQAVGYYHLTNTCNTWTASMLNTAGVPIRTILTLTASSVMKQVRAALMCKK